MGRHAHGQHTHGQHTRRRRPGPATLGVALATVLAVAAAVWVVTRPDDEPTAAGPPGCRVDDTVRVTVEPGLGALARGLLSGPIPIEGGGCTVAEVRTEEPLQTLGVLAGTDLSAQPQVWVPDDTSWATRAGEVATPTGTTLARTSLVLATSRAAAEGLGWTTSAPGWAQALSAPSGAVLPDPVAEPAGLLALAALQTGAGGGEPGDTAVVQAVVAAGRQEQGTAQALASAVAGDPDAPVAVVTEQQVRETTAAGAGDLVVVVPAEGAPELQVPVLRTAAGQDDAAAVQAVLDRLAVAAADGADVRAAGWRDATGRAGEDGDQPPVLALAADLLAALPGRVADLAVPSRLLTVVDTSASMAAEVGGGTRAELARDALTSALAVLPDRTVGALWVFAARLDGDRDWRELVPPRPFGTPVDGATQRQVLADRFAQLPDLLTTGGTGLYDTVLAAVRAARDGYDPAAVNTVVLITDGTDDDPSGIGQQELLDTLAAEADPARPVQVVAVGIGPDADTAALQAVAAATGGTARSALDPGDLQTVLFDALRSR